MDDLRSPDPFLVAWGEVSTWRGAQYQAQLLAALPPDLLDWQPGPLVKMTRALGQAHALRNYLVSEVDQLVPSLRSPYLHRAMSALRSSRRGPRQWRRYWINRASSMSDFVETEHATLARSRIVLDAWCRALNEAIVSLQSQRSAFVDLSPPPSQSREWLHVLARIKESEEGLAGLREVFFRLTESTESMRLKAELFADVCNAVPSHEDALTSRPLAMLTEKLIEVPASGLPGSLE